MRYNVDDNEAKLQKITLPHSKADVEVLTIDPKKAIQSLLTDPRITDEDYLFINGDPFCPPPDSIKFIQDLDTGRSYRKTYEALTQNPKKKYFYR